MNSSCIEKVTGSNIVCAEKRSKFVLYNPCNEPIDKIKVDGCIYPKGHASPCCDYALNHGNKTIFIELKGSKPKQAMKQIMCTISDNKFPINDKKYAVIVTTKMPKFDTSFQGLEDKFNNMKISIIRGNRTIEKNLDSFAE